VNIDIIAQYGGLVMISASKMHHNIQERERRRQEGA
jgi:hypothetical protein